MKLRLTYSKIKINLIFINLINITKITNKKFKLALIIIFKYFSKVPIVYIYIYVFKVSVFLQKYFTYYVIRLFCIYTHYDQI